MFKKYYIIIFVFVLTLHNSFSQTGWQELDDPSNGGDLFGIYFKDINTGLCGPFKTTTGGQTWYEPTGIFEQFYMKFTNPNTGYYVGPTIYKTTNVGETWIQQIDLTGNVMYDAHFINEMTGFACGYYGKIIKTTNGGLNWYYINSSISSHYDLRSIFFVNENFGFVTGCPKYGSDSSIISKTTDGGNTWTVNYYPEHTALCKIHFLNQNTGLIVGYIALKTTDGGNTWVNKQIPNLYCFSMYFPSQTTGYSVGDGIIKTTDYGETWAKQTTPPLNVELNSVYFLNDLSGFVCGFRGCVLRTTNGGNPIGINSVSSQVPKSYQLFQNYPNPFNPSTNIKYQIPKSIYVNLVVYDILGKEVAVLVNEKQNPGTYEVDWNGSNYPSGVYFYKLSATGGAVDFTETKKMILVR